MIFTMDTGTVFGATFPTVRASSVVDLAKSFVNVQSPHLSTENTSEDRGNFTDELPTVRSLAMSANIASTVKSEVKHLIRINTCDDVSISTKNEEQNLNSPKVAVIQKSESRPVHGPVLSCSRILPPADQNVISAIVLSKWDDIMGPQTVHVWMEEVQEGTCGVDMSRAVKYITNHTVSQAAVQNMAQPSTFIVADLDLVAEALAFGVSEQGNDRGKVPHAISLLVPLQRYSSFLQLRHLCHQWLLRTATHLHLHLKDSPPGISFSTNLKLDGWMLELCYMLFSMKSCGLDMLPQKSSFDILTHPLLERALTSHLQTFGCTVVMGTSVQEINQFISFLALFLSSAERVCSRLVVPSMKYSFHVGLFLQGLLLDEFGRRDLCSTELSASPYPVSAIDLSYGAQLDAVRQTPLLPLNRIRYFEEVDLWSYVADDITSVHRSILHPVKDSAPLVKEFLRDLKALQLPDWSTFVSLFMQKINMMAYCLLSQINYTRCFESNATSSASSLPLYNQLMKSLNLNDSDFLIVLAAAEKLKPGVYTYILQLNGDSR